MVTVEAKFVSYVSDILRPLTGIHEVLRADNNPRLIHDVVVEICRFCISDIDLLHVHLTALVYMVRLRYIVDPWQEVVGFVDIYS